MTVSNNEVNAGSTATSTRMRALSVEPTILQMALLIQTEDDDRVRRAEQSSEFMK